MGRVVHIYLYIDLYIPILASRTGHCLNGRATNSDQDVWILRSKYSLCFIVYKKIGK